MAKPNIILRGVMFAVWLVLLVICVLAYTGDMGDTIADVAKKNDSPLTPQGYTFYSFAIIGVLEGVGCLYALFPHGYEGPTKDRWKTKTVNAIGPWWVIGFACQILWLILWVQGEGATFIISLGLQVAGLISFAIAYGLLMKMTSEHGKKSKRSVSAPSYIFFYIPTVMNMAWLTIATCIGLLAIIQHYHKDLDTKVYAKVSAIILTAIVTFVGLLIEGFHVSVFYGLTLIWTFTGLFIKADKDANKDDKSKMMEQALLVCLILLILITAFSIVVSIFRFFRKRDDKEEPLKDTSSSDDEQQTEPAAAV